MAYTGLLPTEQELKDYYGDYPVHADVSAVTLKRYDELLDRFEPWRHTGRMLDVGCGAGNFLQRALGRGWRVHGTEYGAKALAACRAKGIDIIEGALDPANYPPGHFDVVCSFEVIEHVAHPAIEMGRMAQVARPDGLLYITTPNYRCVGHLLAGAGWSVVNYPEHLNYFTPKTLRNMARAHGLDTAWVHTTGIDLARVRATAGTDGARKRAIKDGQEQLRERMEENGILNLAKRLVNGALDLTGIGDHMKAGLVRRPQ